MFTREELEAMRLADEEIEREFAETEEEAAAADQRDQALYEQRMQDKWERQREQRRKYYRENREKALAYNAEYNRTHKQKIAAQKREYYLGHKEDYRRREQAKKQRYRETLPEEITTVLCRFWKENRISRDTFAKNVGVSPHTAYQWGYRTAKPNTKKIRAAYPALADELDRIMEAAA